MTHETQQLRANDGARMIVVTRPSERARDSEHGFVRGWGVTGLISGSKSLSMAYGMLLPGVQANAHLHTYETAIFIISGKVRVHFGDELENSVDVAAQDFLFIPPYLPHKPVNLGDVPMEYVVARDAPEESGESLEAAVENQQERPVATNVPAQGT